MTIYSIMDFRFPPDTLQNSGNLLVKSRSNGPMIRLYINLNFQVI